MIALPVRAQDYDVWRACSISSVNMCTPTGCSSREPTISIYIGFHSDGAGRRAVYLRCATAFVRCDRYDPVVRRLGEFVIFSLPERSVFSKLGTDNKLVDVAAVRDTVFVARGRCVEAAPPARSQWRSGQDSERSARDPYSARDRSSGDPLAASSENPGENPGKT